MGRSLSYVTGQALGLPLQDFLNPLYQATIVQCIPVARVQLDHLSPDIQRRQAAWNRCVQGIGRQVVLVTWVPLSRAGTGPKAHPQDLWIGDTVDLERSKAMAGGDAPESRGGIVIGEIGLDNATNASAKA